MPSHKRPARVRTVVESNIPVCFAPKRVSSRNLTSLSTTFFFRRKHAIPASTNCPASLMPRCLKKPTDFWTRSASAKCARWPKVRWMVSSTKKNGCMLTSLPFPFVALKKAKNPQDQQRLAQLLQSLHDRVSSSCESKLSLFLH